MGNIELLEILLLITLVVILYLLFKEVNQKRYLGDLLLRLPRDKGTKGAIVFWVVLTLVWVFFAGDIARNIGRPENSFPIRRILTPLVWLFISILHVLRAVNANIIREKGVITKEGFVYWKDMTNYQWISDNQLEFTYQMSGRIAPKWKAKKQWTVEKEYKKQVEEIFSRYSKGTGKKKK